MRLSSIIDQMGIKNEEKTERLFTLACMFESDLPSNLYRTHYELEETLGGDKAEWQEFIALPQVKSWMKKELATIVSAQSRKAVKNLENPESQMAVSSAKAMLELDKQLTEQEDTTKFIYTHIPLSKKKGGD
jgi:hypothetical protein